MKKTLLATLLAISVFPSVSFAASFDCAKAGSDVEKIICKEDYLAVLDERLAGYYEKVLETSSSKDAVKKSQIEWLKKQRTCKDEDCLSELYNKRIEELWRILAVASDSHSSSSSSAKYKAAVVEHSIYPINPHYPVCNVFADYLNSKYYKPGDCTVGDYPPDNRLQPIKYTSVDVNKYRAQLVESWVKKNSEVPNAKGVQNKYIDAGNVHLWAVNVDLDNDGKSESFLIRRDISKDELNSYGCTSLARSTSLILNEGDNFIDKGGDVYGEPIIFSKKTYLISSSGKDYMMYEPNVDKNTPDKVLDLSPMCSISK